MDNKELKEKIKLIRKYHTEDEKHYNPKKY